jgi:hypothetical protein
VAEDPQEDLLGYVLAIGRGHAQESDDAEHAALVTGNERLERADIAPAGRLDEGVISRIGFCQNELLFPRTSTAMTE